MKREIFLVLLICLIGQIDVLGQTSNPNSNTSRTSENVYSAKSMNKQKERSITNEDTVIVTPTYRRVVKKKDYYSGNINVTREIQINEGDSIISTPEYKKIIRKNPKEK
ncbi:MAG: hypothetical protein N3F62_01030 [Bacteroidia bacterium]|nr:hypothetical protein [Bacteroidia bacterium]